MTDTTFRSIVPVAGDIVAGSLTDMARQNGGKITPPELIVLFDISYSMNDRDATLLDGLTASRYQAGCEQLAIIQRKLPGKVAVIAFSQVVTVCPNGVPPEPESTTNLRAALEKAKGADSGTVRFVVISDGLPDDPGAALELAQAFTGKIDTVLVGNLSEYYRAGAVEFMTKLAATTGGTFMRDASGMRALAEGVMLLLGAGPIQPA
ncbi:VWA domain-containing protein [Chloroflexales bacterium ZM16-3]|nr:VWA domain-containing protein [Chloroflexales bacterium ZM16-3]